MGLEIGGREKLFVQSAWEYLHTFRQMESQYLAWEAWGLEVAVTFAVIRLSELLQLADDHGHRVTTTDDVEFRLPIKSKSPPDLTSLIKICRGAAAHPLSDLKQLPDDCPLGFARLSGGLGMQINGVDLINPYSDDIAIFWGPQRLLVRRNLFRAMDELEPFIGRVLHEKT